jgi:type I restriction enzyme S subunit
LFTVQLPLSFVLACIRAEGIRLIQTGNIGIGHYREKGFRFIDEETFVAFRCTEIMPGDVLICRLGDPVGRACLAPNLGVRMIASVDVCILKPNESAIAAFLVYAMSSPVYLEWIGSLVRGSTRDRVSRSMLGRFCVPLPPLPEQTAIVEYLDAETAKLDTAIAVARREIELLREYRERLIADVVTGKVDVREVAVQLPYEPPEEEAGTEEEKPVADELATVDSQEEANGEE